MWSWIRKLFAPAPEIVPQQVWLNSAARDRAVARVAREAAGQGAAVCIIACFPDQMVATAAALGAAGVEYELWRPAATFADIQRELRDQGGRVLLTHIELLPAPKTDDQPARTEAASHAGPEIVLIGAEVFPVPTFDARLLAFAAALPARSLTVHVALDDAVLGIFAGPSIRTMLQQLGMREDEAIESPMVSRRITDARKKLAERQVDNRPADSAEEWLKRNTRALGG